MSSNKNIEDAKCLALEPGTWDIDLANGSVLHVLSDMWHIDGDDCVFSLLFEGTPNIDVESLRIPLRLLDAKAIQSLDQYGKNVPE
jgi:hypothetical protein